MSDSCICPHCDTTLDVEIYGHNLECSECLCPLAVFHDDDIRVETPVGVFWISLPEVWRMLCK